MTEGQLLRDVTGLAEQLGLLWHHCSRSERCQGSKGLPDLILLGKHGLILVELKTDDGRTSAEQDEWLWRLQNANVNWATWRPMDFESGAIRRYLESIR